MRRIYNKFLVISTIGLIIGGVYLHFSHKLNTDIVNVAFGSSLVSTIDPSLETNTLDQKINSDISFLTTLVSLKKINIDTTLFSNKSFNALENNAVKIEPVLAGRPNPFAPVNQTNIANQVSALKVITDQVSGITGTTAVFNGTVNVATGVTDTYFEYGLTDKVEIPTSTVKQSLVGTFIKNVSGLTPKTTYFYRACAKINGIKLCGDTVSFNTN